MLKPALSCQKPNYQFLFNYCRYKKDDRGRKGPRPSPPSEPCMRFSRTRLSSRWFPHRDWRARMWALCMVKSPCSAKKAFGHCLWSRPVRPEPGRFFCFRSTALRRRHIRPSRELKVWWCACLKYSNQPLMDGLRSDMIFSILSPRVLRVFERILSLNLLRLFERT